MRRIESSRVPDHADKTGFLLLLEYGFRIGPAVRQRDFDLHMLARLQTRQRLRRVHLGGRAQNDGIDFG